MQHVREHKLFAIKNNRVFFPAFLLDKIFSGRDYIVSVDLGQSQDYSAMAVLRRQWWRTGERPDPSTAKLWHEIPQLIRWPLDTPYPKIIQNIVEAVRYIESVAKFGVALVVDQGGPGRPVIDLLKKAKVRPIGITIIAGDHVTIRPDESMTCPKRDICAALVVAAQSGDLKVSNKLPLADDFETEVKAFGYTINRRTAKMGYESIVAKVNDDLVVSAAMGLWYSTQILSTAFVSETGRQTADDYHDYDPLA